LLSVGAAALVAVALRGVATASCPAPPKPAVIVVPGRPFSAIPTADGCWLFVSLSDESGRGWVAVLRNVRGLFGLHRMVALEAGAHGEALSADEQVLAITTQREVALLDVPRLEESTSDPIISHIKDRNAQPVYAVVSRDNKLLFVSDEVANRISVFKLVSRSDPHGPGSALIGYIPIASGPIGLAVSPDGRWVYATDMVAPGSLHLRDRCVPPMGDGVRQSEGVVVKIDIDKARTDPRTSVVAAFLAYDLSIVRWPTAAIIAHIGPQPPFSAPS
jgi:hypothetical protein